MMYTATDYDQPGLYRVSSKQNCVRLCVAGYVCTPYALQRDRYMFAYLSKRDY